MGENFFFCFCFFFVPILANKIEKEWELFQFLLYCPSKPHRDPAPRRDTVVTDGLFRSALCKDYSQFGTLVVLFPASTKKAKRVKRRGMTKDVLDYVTRCICVRYII